MPPALPVVADSRSRQSYLPRKVRLIVNRALVQHLSKGQSKRYGINRLGLIPPLGVSPCISRCGHRSYDRPATRAVCGQCFAEFAIRGAINTIRAMRIFTLFNPRRFPRIFFVINDFVLALHFAERTTAAHD